MAGYVLHLPRARGACAYGAVGCGCAGGGTRADEILVDAARVELDTQLDAALARCAAGAVATAAPADGRSLDVRAAARVDLDARRAGSHHSRGEKGE